MTIPPNSLNKIQEILGLILLLFQKINLSLPSELAFAFTHEFAESFSEGSDMLT